MNVYEKPSKSVNICEKLKKVLENLRKAYTINEKTSVERYEHLRESAKSLENQRESEKSEEDVKIREKRENRQTSEKS